MKDKVAYSGWLTVLQRTLGGRTYDILADRDAVCSIIINDKSEILFVE